MLLASAAAVSAADLRIATYNIDADTGGTVGQIGGPDAGPELIPVLEAIGAIHLGDGIAKPIERPGTGGNGRPVDHRRLYCRSVE